MVAAIVVMATGLRPRALPRRRLAAAAGLAAALAGGGVAVHAQRGSDPAPASGPASQAVATLPADAAPPALAGAARGGPATAAADGVPWVATGDAVRRIDGDRVHTAPVGREPAGIALGAQIARVANAGDGTVSRLAP